MATGGVTMVEPLARDRYTVPLVDDFGWTDIAGAKAGVARAAIKAADRDDLVVLYAPGTAAAVTTRSTAAAAPCIWTRARVPGRITAVVVNAGNANASTGPAGMRDTLAMASSVAQHIGCTPDEVLVCSTGVIGVSMPMERVLPGIDRACAQFDASTSQISHAILTTDLVEKVAAARAGGALIAGFAKGSGMIHPDMATMLGFVVTDAAVDPEDLQSVLEDVNARTFNAITVDGDMSTNDTLILQATGQGPAISPQSPEWPEFVAGVHAVCQELARAIARDGEGATHLITVEIEGLDSDASARRAARAVCRSPLVKTAIAGRDANWGRIVGALGAAMVPDLDVLDLDVAGIPVLRGGRPVPFDEEVATAALSAHEVIIRGKLPGAGFGVAWGSDLTEGYIRINADYRS